MFLEKIKFVLMINLTLPLKANLSLSLLPILTLYLTYIYWIAINLVFCAFM